MDFHTLFLNIFSSITASVVVIFFLYSLRPRIEISKEISEQENDSGIPTYRFKIINKTRYPIFDVQVILELVTTKCVPGGQIISTKRLDLIKDKFIIVKKFDISDSAADYAFRVRTTEKLRDIWETQSQYLRISVLARHEMSGFYGVFQQNYYTKSDIIKGTHRYGISLDVQKDSG